MQAHRQAETRVIDSLDGFLEIFCLVTVNVQHGPEHFFGQRSDRIDFDECRRHEGSICMRFVERHAMQDLLLLLHTFNVLQQGLPRRVIDDRTDVGGQPRGITNDHLFHVPDQQLLDLVRDVFLDAKYA